MKILGIDPGSHLIGYGLIEKNNGRLNCLEYGTISIKKQEGLTRLLTIKKEITRLLEKHRPDLASIEKLFFFKNQKTFLAVAETRGVLILCLLENKVSIVEFTPLEIKQSVSGYGRAQKTNIQKIVKLILNMDKEPRPDDAADALAAAICASTSPTYMKP